HAVAGKGRCISRWRPVRGTQRHSRFGSLLAPGCGLRKTGNVWTDDQRGSNDVSAATWIAARLGGKFGVVARTVPRGYPAYVRICHPAADNDGRPVGWSEVAGSTGRQAHPLMQWHALVGSQDSLNMTDSLWRGSNPQRGNLEPEVLGPLCDLLSGHTADPEHCFFCLWD